MKVKNDRKLLGIEFSRGLTAYSVVLVHSGDETWGLPIDNNAIEFRTLFYFAVPFFIASAFYFATTKSELVYSTKFWHSKFKHILVPYTVWSIIFFIFRVIIFTLTKKPDRLQQMWQDPLGIIFFGEASFQLYFLPLLFTGFLLLLLIPMLEKWQMDTLGRLSSLAVISVALYTALENSGNGFRLSGMSIAFKSLASSLNIDLTKNPLLRLILVEIAWVITCLPYFSISLIPNKLRLTEKLDNAKYTVPLCLATILVLCNTLGRMFLPGGLSHTLLGFSLLWLSISISKYFTNAITNQLIINIGSCSFGIYLIHPFVMGLVRPSIGKIFPIIEARISIFSMLMLSLFCFTISWAIVAYINKNKLGNKVLFGS